MYLSRVIFCVVSLSVLLMFLALQTSCGDEKPQVVKLTLTCTTSLNVDPNKGVDRVDAYICDGTKVTWNANGHDFHVFFKKKCPFQEGCRHIDNQHPYGTLKAHTTLTVYDYGIRVDDDAFDPHVVGGGG
jgi:hypothetical protein